MIDMGDDTKISYVRCVHYSFLIPTFGLYLYRINHELGSELKRKSLPSQGDAVNLNGFSVVQASSGRYHSAMRRMFLILLSVIVAARAAESFAPAKQHFQQEIASRFDTAGGLPPGPIQLLDLGPDETPRVFSADRWFELRRDRWMELQMAQSDDDLVLADVTGHLIPVSIPKADARQVLRSKNGLWVATDHGVFAIQGGKAISMRWSNSGRIHQIAAAPDGTVYAASSAGLFLHGPNNQSWAPIAAPDGLGRTWTTQDVLGVAFDSNDQLWFATKAGVGCRTSQGWRFWEGKDGLPWNEFTGITAGPSGTVWFGTRRGAIRYDGKEWHYRQGPRWLPNDDVQQILVTSTGKAWIRTPTGVGLIEQKPMTLAEKAAHYENEIARYIKRTPFGFVAEAHLRAPADKSTAASHDSDNDGLWTSMYGAGQCFAFAATGDPQAKARAKQAFEALRFLQKVTQGGSHSPPNGYIARTVRSTELPDPNIGRLEQDRAEQKSDRLWKVYEPRWPRSADGKWFWKSDTSSDELDGHYFFYPLYFEFCADTDSEKERVREVVRDVTDHLIQHRFVLIDHDGRPTRWAIFGPQFLNRDPDWWQERGLNSLSVLSYLAVAASITGDAKYEKASRELIEKHGYALNAMYPKAQAGPGSGNQSDDEMAFMSFYSLLRYSKDEALKAQIRFSFFRYWVNEAPELNPFFNFAYASQNLSAQVTTVWRAVSLSPWEGWFEDSMATLYGFPLDRLNWPHQNSHRLDVQPLRSERAQDLSTPQRRGRGHRVNGKVLPIENRHFNHWNTDPWTLDYGGNGTELAAGTVFLLPYYMGLYHGFIEKP